ncbi:MAG: iron-sulfur cluster assembly scaffold protein [Candidatus Diapherotrites archaeon]|nr:iron-sulfur cluster assembly scaffold protein [Candidatus Diapherotrites archaeon]
MYSEKAMKHFKSPQNMGEIKGADGVGKVGNIVCGDVMWLYIKVGKDKKGREIIKDAKWRTFGCVAAIATSSVVSTIAKGKTIEELIELSNERIVEELKGLPPVKVHCSLLAVDALHEAIYDYLTKKKRQVPEKLEKKHRRIIEEIERIEKRYKDFIKAEESLVKRK